MHYAIGLLALVLILSPLTITTAAQEASIPRLTADQSTIVELNNELERLANDVQNALEQVATLQARVNVLTRAYNTLRLSLVREQSTPELEGWIFDWTIDPETGQRRGLIKRLEDAEEVRPNPPE